MRQVRLLDGIAWALIAGAAVVLLTQVVGTPLGIIAAAQALSPFALLVVVPLAVAASTTGRAVMGFAAAIVGCGYLALLAPLVFAGSGPAPDPGATPLTVMTTNLLYSNARPDEVGDLFESIDADVIAMSEVTPETLDVLRAHPTADSYPHRVESPAALAGGLTIWSRYPLGPEGERSDFRRSIATSVLIGEAAVRLVLVHPPPPVFNRLVWNRELDAIDDVVRQTTLPTAVLGDLNASWFHPAFRSALRNGDLHDSLTDVGKGTTMTWPTDEWVPPFVTLDHVLLDDRLATIDAVVVTVPGSDHRAIVATFTLAEP